MKIYRYAGLAKFAVLFLKICGVTTLIGTLVMALFLLSNASLSNEPSTAICLGIYVIAVGAILGSLLLNMFPDIKVTDKGLEVEFFWRNLDIAWDEVIDIRPLGSPFGHIHAVRAKRITPLHRLYGLIYTKSISPALLIRDSISDSSELIQGIRRRTG